MRADRVVGRLAGSDQTVVRREVHTDLQQCDLCRDMVPFTTLVIRSGDLVCSDCHDEDGALRRMFPGLFEDEA